jgi:YVTN family beta-propeller protein
MTRRSIHLIVTVLLVSYCISGAVNSTQAQIEAYVTNECNATVSVIDSTSNTVVNTISLGIAAFNIAITPDGTRVYLTDPNTGIVSVVGTATNTVIAAIPLSPNIRRVAVAPDGTRAYVMNPRDGTASVINTATNTPIGAAIQFL